MTITAKRLFRLLGVLILVGCAAGPEFAAIQSSIPDVPPEQGRVWFYRAASPFGAALQPPIEMNGEIVGQSVPGGFFYRDVAPGDYEIATSTEVERRLTFSIAEGEELYVKTRIGLGVLVGRVYPELVDPETGRAAIEELSFTGTLP